MKVKLTGENKVIEVNDSYGLRLITQGKALPVKAAALPPRKKAEKPKGDA